MEEMTEEEQEKLVAKVLLSLENPQQLYTILQNNPFISQQTLKIYTVIKMYLYFA